MPNQLLYAGLENLAVVLGILGGDSFGNRLRAFKPAGRIQVDAVFTGMKGAITLRAPTRNLDVAETPG